MTLNTTTPRGERSNFMRICITIPPDLWTKIKSIGTERKVNGMKDCDVSSLTREAITQWIDKQIFTEK